MRWRFCPTGPRATWETATWSSSPSSAWPTRLPVDLVLETAGLSVATAGLSFAESEIEHHEIEGVSVPFASARLLLKMRQTGREKDALDRMFLEQKVEREDNG